MKPPAKLCTVTLLLAALPIAALPRRHFAAADSGPDCVRSVQHAVPSGDQNHPTCRPQANADYCYQCAEVTNDVPGKPWWICTEPQGFAELGDDEGPCSHFGPLEPSWFGSPPDEQFEVLNDNPGLGDDGE